MRRSSISKSKTLWVKLNEKKRSDFNEKYRISKADPVTLGEFFANIEGNGINIPSDYSDKDPKDIPLSRAIRFIKRDPYTGDIEIYYKDDVSDREILEIERIIKSEMNLG